MKYFLKIGIKNLFKSNKFALLNIIGLSVGVTVGLLILLYVHYETSFDNFNPNANNIYRVAIKNIQDGSIKASTPLALSDVLKTDYPEIDKVIGLLRVWKPITLNNVKYENLHGAIVEKDFFEMFNFPLIIGSQTKIFQDPYEVVITTNLANTFFGDENPLGKTLEYENHIFTITGVIDPMPSNSIFDFDFFLSDNFRYITYPDLNERWYQTGLFTFITFKGNVLPQQFDSKLSNIEKQYYPDFMKNRHNYLLAKFKGSHLNPTLGNDLTPTIAPFYLWILAAIAMSILVIACLNFMNISIANAGKKNIETGIKKVSGASFNSLIWDYLSEVILFVFISFIIACFGVFLLLPSFNNLVEKEIIINFSDPVLWGGAIGFGILTILISGIYPAIVLSRPSAIQILLKNKGKQKNKMSFQRSLVVFQFAITIVLATAQLFIIKQISFMQNHETGFAKENLITIPVRLLGNNGAERMKNTNLFVDDLEKHQSQYGYGKASITEFVPGFGYRNRFNVFNLDDNSSDFIEMLSSDVDENFAEVFGLNNLQGRFFSKELSTDKNAVVINMSAYKKLGWKSLDGKSIGLFSRDNIKKVVGVVNDINIKSMQYPVESVIYQFGRHHTYPRYITLKYNPLREAETIEFIKNKWTKMFPEIQFAYERVEDKYLAAYGEEERLAKTTGTFSLLAMLLSLFGIFALAAIESEKRTKEIGIRRVNGAKMTEILYMLNMDFVKWVAIAFLIATPIAYYAMNSWLKNFAYKTELTWWIFALAGIIALFIALITVSWQSFKAARRNPVEVLRYE